MTPAHIFNPDHSLRRIGALLEDTAPAGFRNRDLTLAECRAMANAAQPEQPTNALYSRTADELAGALFSIAGPLNRKVR